jgi:hypothetical protein
MVTRSRLRRGITKPPNRPGNKRALRPGGERFARSAEQLGHLSLRVLKHANPGWAAPGETGRFCLSPCRPHSFRRHSLVPDLHARTCAADMVTTIAGRRGFSSIADGGSATRRSNRCALRVFGMLFTPSADSHLNAYAPLRRPPPGTTHTTSKP